MNVLSLFDGMSCGQIALEKLGIKVNNYFASEIKKHGIKVTKENYPDTNFLGDVLNVSYSDGVLKSENGEHRIGEIDLLLGGSPCQNFSLACIKEKRLGLNGEKSRLFYEYLRILKETKPKYFLLENVSGMDSDSKKQLDEYLGVEGIFIDTLSFLPQSRKRLYWTNIPIEKLPEQRDKDLQDILDFGYTPRKYSSCLMEGHSRGYADKLRLTRRYMEKYIFPVVFESEEHYKELSEHYKSNYKGLSAKEVDAIREGIDNSVYDSVRYYTKKEMERLQGVPEGYTSSVSWIESASLLGDGWTVDVIAHILRGIK